MKGKALATFAVVALLTAVPALAQANPVTTITTVPVNFTAANPCTGEDIDFSGTVNVVDHVTLIPVAASISTGASPDRGYYRRWSDDRQRISVGGCCESHHVL